MVDLQKKIKELEQENARLHSQLRTDELTRVLNRRGIEEEIEVLFEEAKYTRQNGPRRKLSFADVSLIFLDIDNFKSINDTYGHDSGDVVLEAISRLIAESIRGIDHIGRMGGEEFVVVLPGAEEEDAYHKAESLRKKVSMLVFGDKLPSKITASFGVSSVGASEASSPKELVEQADSAMYEAKHERGKNTVVKYSEITSI